MIDIIQDRLNRYVLKSDEQKDKAVREIVQEIVIFALAKANFFEVALFNGGTSLRILHGLSRFSEDLDFVLKHTNPDFRWENYQNDVLDTLLTFGIRSELKPKGRMDDRVRKALLKDNSVTEQIDLSFVNRDPKQKIRIKLEIDVYPPKLAGSTETLLEFPIDHMFSRLDLETNFASKIHALLCRYYLKGRDWYDFSWYVRQKVTPNLPYLNEALKQQGPWKDVNDLEIDFDWLTGELSRKIRSIDWKRAKNDVQVFLYSDSLDSLHLWDKKFFDAKLSKLIEYSVGN